MIILQKQILVILVSRSKTNGFFIIKNIRKRIYIKRFNEFAFMVDFNKEMNLHWKVQMAAYLGYMAYLKYTNKEFPCDL